MTIRAKRLVLMLLTAVLLGCGACRDTFTGSWRWTENDVPAYTNIVVNLTQSASSVMGIVENKVIQQCRVSGTVNGHDLQGAFAAPCNQSFTVTLSSDHKHLQVSLAGSGAEITAVLLPSARN